MSLLSGAQLDAMRATAEQALPGTAVIRRLTRDSDGGGGFTETWTDVATVACRIAPLAGGERITSSARGSTVGERVVDETTNVVTLPATADVTEKDRLVIDGRTYDVALIRRYSQPVTLRVEVKETA